MATANPIITANTESTDNFKTRIQLVRQEIKAEFQKLVGAIRERESQLMDQLDEIEKEMEQEIKNQNEIIAKLEKNRNHCVEDLDNEILRNLKGSMLTEIDKKVNELERDLTRKIDIKNAKFYIEQEKIYAALNKSTMVYTFEMDPVSLIQYRKIVVPVFSGGNEGYEIGEMEWGNRITVDPRTDNIYVCNFGNSFIQVFNTEGTFLFRFGDQAEEQMLGPINSALSEDIIYVLCYLPCVMVYTLDGEYVDKFGKNGSGDGEMKFPTALEINSDKEIFVCDGRFYMDRIVVFGKDHNFKSNLTYEDLKNPRDIKITANQDILVLADYQDEATFFTFNREREFINKITLTPGELGYFCFCLDSQDNILLCDEDTNAIHFLTSDGKLFHQIGGEDSDTLNAPCGLAIDNKKRIIVIDKNENCLHFF